MPATQTSTKTKDDIRAATVKSITGLITAAFGLVAALAWNGAIQKMFSLVFGAQGDLAAMVGYAVLVTIIAVVVTVYLGRVAGKLGAV